MTDFPTRAYNHSFRIDPIVRFLSDTDFYKLLMHQFIWRNYMNTSVTFQTKNRTKSIRLADNIDIEELRAQLDHVTTLKWTHKEINFLKAQEFYGTRDLFCSGYIDYLQRSFKLSPYTIEEVDGQIILTFTGLWLETTLWEIYALTIMNEMRYRHLMATMSKTDLDIMYAQAKVKLYRKLKKLKRLGKLNLTDFGTRRRHSFLWQQYCVLLAKQVLGDAFTGTSNVYLAMEHGLDAKGTNAHEIPMVLGALAKTDEELKESQYRVCQQWQDDYRGGLLIILPDTFGTTQFLNDAPQWLSNWTGFRPDSKEPIAGGEEIMEWFDRMRANPEEKLIIFSDGLDVEIDGFAPQGSDIPTIYDHFDGKIRMGFGWGTMLTNDFIGCHPDGDDIMKPISLVCKVSEADLRPAVKLSDNYDKATGPAEEIERYRRVFGSAGMKNAPVNV
jgi:nicotinate phosphoribosyltransferase